MEIEITSEENNDLLNRKEVRFSVVHDEETPARLAVRDSLAAKLDRASDEVIVHELDTRFGMNETLGRAKVYDSPETAKEVEQEYMLERNKVGDEAEEAEAETEQEEAEDTEAEEEEAEEQEETEQETEEVEEETEEEAAEEAGEDEESGEAGDETEEEPDSEADEEEEEAEA